jgi:heme/copper-type cytochrome/quinol oxidase subunit 2
MILICIVVAVIALVVFMAVSAENRKRKQQNPIPYNTTDEPKKQRAPGLD